MLRCALHFDDVIVFFRPSLDPESAGSTVVSQAGVSNVQQIFRNSKFSKFDLDIPDTWRAEVREGTLKSKRGG